MSDLVITNQPQLDALCERLHVARRIAFDTEFVSEHTYRPQLCLVQVATEAEAVCVDSLASIGLAPLWNALTAAGNTVVVHAARQEFLFVHEASGRRPAGLFDVQLAAGMIGLEFPAGYGNLISRLLGIAPEKGETRTDWRRRPLSDRQISYAVADVKHLLPLHDLLVRRLSELKREHWFADETEAFQVEVEEYRQRDRWRRVPGSSGMSNRCKAILRELWTWREREAERRDLPPRLILRDDLMVEMAKRKLADPKQLGAIRGMERPELRRALPDFARAIERGLQVPDGELPTSTYTPDAGPQMTMLGQFLSSALSSICRAASIAPSLVGTANDVRELVNYRLGADGPNAEPPTLARGWRAEVVGHLIEDLLMGRMSIRIADPTSEHPLVFEPSRTARS